jgi:seryl-tRNA synthetase
MLDIRFIRENPELVEEKSKQKGYEVDLTHLLKIDKDRRDILAKIEKLRSKRNELSNQLKKTKPSSEQIALGKDLKKQLDELERQLDPLEVDFDKHLKAVPNMPAGDVPIGSSPEQNVATKHWGGKPQFDFKPKSHWEIAESRGLIDKQRAAKVAGSRFAYIIGDLALLQFALLQFAIDSLSSEQTIKKIIQKNDLKNVSSKPFKLILPPAMIRTEVFEAMDRLEPRDERYKVGTDEDNLWLQGSAEHTIGPMFMNETLDGADLPLRYAGYATSFRREAGSYGKDIEGIIRMHQFDKLEMESFSRPEDGLAEHLLMVAIQEYLMQQLGLAYRVLNKCTADIGKPNARGVDIEVWLPSQNRYLETHTADFITDYQSRRLQTRFKSEAGSGLVHTNDATVFAMGRALVAIIENHQTADGQIEIPKALMPYMKDKSTI